MCPLIEPNRYETEWVSNSASHAQNLDAYDDLKAAVRNGDNLDHYGVPTATVNAVMKLVDYSQPLL
ncbi:hypothetical protein [Fibrella forsythiae]|uniref:hypothetical protein n=1 Tax=Fibrella forsythiae TaxID=2817061 RepID=UPI001E5A3057|nr:hypothetical protein [Fibrella forsythiae]